MPYKDVIGSQWHESWHRLCRRWEGTKTVWDDPVQQRFEREFWQPLEAEVVATHRELERLAQVVAQARQRVHLTVKERTNLEDSRDTDAIYLVVFGLQRARDLRQEDDFSHPFSSRDDETVAPDPAKQFNTILQEGPDAGVHTLVWCDSYANLTRTLDRRVLREFEMRVGLQMGAEDSTNLFDSPAASRLGAYQALYFSEEEGRLEKFRPYGLPSEQWLTWAEGRFRGKV